MCGIIARIGTGDGVDELLTALTNLNYRGYDSAGIAAMTDAKPRVTKCEGDIDQLKAMLDGVLRGPIGIGHTRWSTHGPPTDANAHPHTDCTGSVAVVHNGIIENYDSLRTELKSRGHVFTSDTDTEVVPHLVEEFLAKGLDTEAAFRRTVERIDGSYALAMIVEGDEAVYATRSGSPLVLGVGSDAYYLASDVPAFLEYTNNVVYLEDDRVVVVKRDGYQISDLSGSPLSPSVETVEWDAEDAEKGGYTHYMLKEIHEQPSALAQTIHGRVGSGGISLKSFPPGSFADVANVHFVACGTSYHAALYGVQLCNARGIPAQAFLASEYSTMNPPMVDDTLTVAVTQSGETADTLGALRNARRQGGRTLAVTNVVGSTVSRESDEVLYIRAGPEIGVAATKTFSSQVVTLAMLAERIASDGAGRYSFGDDEYLTALTELPMSVRQVLEDSSAHEIARRYDDCDSHFFIGRGTGHAVALEGALKFKEITYEHAEAFAAGELKHGPLALVTENTPVFAILSGEHDGKTHGNVQEVKSRGAPVVAITDEPEAVEGLADDVLAVPSTHVELTSLLANVQLQLLSYHAASLRNRAIDKPRNLAKSVTVE